MKPKHLPRLWCALAGVLPLEGTGQPLTRRVGPGVVFDSRNHASADQQLREKLGAETNQAEMSGGRSSVSG